MSELEPFIERVWLIECDRCSSDASFGGQKQAAAREAARQGWQLFPKSIDRKWILCGRCVDATNVAGVLG